MIEGNVIPLTEAGSELFPEGARLGPYRLLARLGTGGMAEVFLGRVEGGPAHGRFVAIKRMRAELTSNPEFVELFLEEARTASLLAHPNICRIHELTSIDDCFFMVMEYLEGVPLSTVMTHAFKHPAAYDVAFVAGIIAQTCDGIHYAHELRDHDNAAYDIVHRDVSPPNLFVTKSGIVKVLDFGISKSKNSLVRTMTGQIRGKFSYMSPEQLKGEKLDCRSDVFSIGIVLFEMLTARRLFRRRNRLNIFHAIVRDPIPSLLDYRPDLSAELADVVARALARNRNQRYSSARELADDLERAAAPFGGRMLPTAIAEVIQHYFGAEIERKRDRYDADSPSASSPFAGSTSTEAPDSDTLNGVPHFGNNDHELFAVDRVDTGAITQVLTAADLTAIDLEPAPELEDDDL
jgi:serine/threonine-protein kinase